MLRASKAARGESLWTYQIFSEHVHSPHTYCDLLDSHPRSKSELIKAVCGHFILQLFLSRFLVACLNFYPLPQAFVLNTYLLLFLTNAPWIKYVCTGSYYGLQRNHLTGQLMTVLGIDGALEEVCVGAGGHLREQGHLKCHKHTLKLRFYCFLE